LGAGGAGSAADVPPNGFVGEFCGVCCARKHTGSIIATAMTAPALPICPIHLIANP